jgi:MFS family permease
VDPIFSPDGKVRVLALTTLGSFMTPFMSSSINIALPSIGREFGLDPTLLGWVASSFLLAAAVFLVPFGKLADLRGRKKIFAVGVGLYALTSFLSAAAPSGALLIVFRAGQGLGGAMMFSTAIALLTSVYPLGERGKALGINTAATYVGLSFGPFGGGLLTQSFGWRSIFVFNGLIGAALFVLVWVLLKGEWAGARRGRFDTTGSLIFGLSLLGLMAGLSLLPSPLGLGLLLGGIGAGVLFVAWEARVASPVLDINLFRRNTVFAFSNLAALINYSATFAVTYFISLYLQYVKGLSPGRTGLILVAQPVIMAAFSPLTGRLSDRVEPRLLASAGMALSAVGLFVFAFLAAGSMTATVLAGLILLGFGFALFSSPNTNAVMSSVDRGTYGLASATLGTMRLTGQMLSMGLAILIMGLTVGPSKVTPARVPAFLHGLRIAFVLFAALCAVGVLASYARGRMDRAGEEADSTR